MEELGKGLGELGFWLAVGLVIAAMVIAGAKKDRTKEQEKQATLRALLEKEGGNTSEILAYLREKDAAELKFARQASGVDWGKGIGAAGVVGFIVIALAIGAGLLSLAYTSPRREFIPAPGGGNWTSVAPSGFDFPLAPVSVMMAIWAGGFIIAALIWWLFGKKKNDAQPGA